jgi:serine/threonine protein kinase
MARERHHNALPSGYKLHWYVIGSVIGKGGFGITYLALDTNLDQRVAIKEFLPMNLATRSSNSHVHPISQDHDDTYGWGLNRFVAEARTLAKFRHPNIVRVMSVFEANSTAYMVMEYERGESLENLLKARKITGEAKLRSILMPLLDGLKVVHEAGFIHRDIKPDNIYLRDNGTPVLLDFGSARQAIGVATRTLTALVTPGYAPFEQYDTSKAGEKKQGPWTDIYSFGATLYRAISGKGPPDAMARVNAVMGGMDILRPAKKVASGEFSPAFLSAIDWALEFLPENRPQSIDEWRAVLAGREARPRPTILPTVTTDFSRAAATEVPIPAVAPAAAGGNSAPPAAGIQPGGAGTESGVGGHAPGRISSRKRGNPPPGKKSRIVAADRNVPPAPPRGSDDPRAKRRDHRNLGRRFAEVFAVAVIIGAMGAWYFLTQPTERSPSRKPVASNGGGEKVAGAELSAAPKMAAQKAAAGKQTSLDEQPVRDEVGHDAELRKLRAAAESERKHARVEHLLRQATADLAADRLTTPTNGNAFSRYRAVLALDPSSRAALEGLHDILTRYLALAKAALDDNDFDLANSYLSKAGAVSPGAESVAAARVALNKRESAYAGERRRAEIEARQTAEDERQRMQALRLATEEERERLAIARRAAEEERQRVKAAREAEIARTQLEQEAIVTAKLEQDFKRSQAIAALLTSAEEAFGADRLTSPPGDNALSDFNAVLAIDTQNADADAGIQRIADRYAQRALKEIAAYRFDQAESLVDQADTIYAGIPSIAPARQQLREGRAAYDGRRPIAKPPYRMTFLQVTGTNTCGADDPIPGIEQLGAAFLNGDEDLDHVSTYSHLNDNWQDSGVNKEPRAERLYVLGRKEKLDGALMYWFSAVGAQCFKVHMDAYLVDLQTRTIYAEEGPMSNLPGLTESLIKQFKDGRRALARTP